MISLSYMKNFSILVAVTLPSFLYADTPSYTVTITTDREDAVYERGSQAVFSVVVKKGDGSVAKDGRLKLEFDDFLNTSTFPVVEAVPGQNPVTVRFGLADAGFLRCRATYTPQEGKSVRKMAAAAFSPDKIGLSLPVPDDFDAFWMAQKEQLAKVPLSSALTQVEQKDASIVCSDVQVRCLGDIPVSGYFAKPVAAETKKLPAVLWVHGAGVRSSSLPNAVKGAKAGMLSMDINAHGIPNGHPAEFYAGLRNGGLKDYRYVGRQSREESYFRGMYLRLVRAIDFLTAQPEWNGQHVVVVGHSQGGGQALVAGGLDDRVTFVATGVPAICDHSGLAAGRVNGWPKLVPAKGGQPDNTIQNAARYVDAVNFASRCKADAIMSIGFIDVTCPPSSCYAAYNALAGKKQVMNEPMMGHAAPPHIHEAFLNAILAHVNAPVTR